MTRHIFLGLGCAVAMLATALDVRPAAAAMRVIPAAVSCGPSVEVEFREGAPKDRFIITNTSQGDWQIEALAIDLVPSSGSLIFDTVPGGAGIDVAQPFQAGRGDVRLLTVTPAPDGARMLSLTFADFTRARSFDFTIDLDDQLVMSATGQTRIEGSEIAGASITVTMADTAENRTEMRGEFDRDARAIAGSASCV